MVESARAAAVPLLSRLTKIAAEGSTKVAQRSEGIQAALAVALAASADSKSESSVPASFWETLAGPKAPLLSTATLAKLAPEAATSQIQLAESLLLQVSRIALSNLLCICSPTIFETIHCKHDWKLSSSGCQLQIAFTEHAIHARRNWTLTPMSLVQHAPRLGASATEQCARLIATAALHHARVVRQAACSVAAHCVREALPLAGQLIAAFQELLRLAPDIPVSHPAFPQLACISTHALYSGSERFPSVLQSAVSEV